MRTMDLNVRIVLLGITFLVLSGMVLNGLMAPSHHAAMSGLDSYPILSSSFVSDNQPEPEKRVISAPLNMENNNQVQAPVVATVVSSEVKAFYPEFDEEWCKTQYPDIANKQIELNSEDMVIRNKNGERITDYQALSLQLAPSGTEESTEKAYSFDDAYVHVKGIGPMKINAIRFQFETAAAMGR
jgi:hypothetical protein